MGDYGMEADWCCAPRLTRTWSGRVPCEINHPLPLAGARQWASFLIQLTNRAGRRVRV